MTGEINGLLVYGFIRDVVLIAAFLWMVLSRRHQASRDTVEKLRTNHDKRLNRHRDQLTRIGTIVEKMPNHDDINLLHDRVGRVKDQTAKIDKEVGSIAATLEGVLNSVKRVDDHLMKVDK